MGTNALPRTRAVRRVLRALAVIAAIAGTLVGSSVALPAAASPSAAAVTAAATPLSFTFSGGGFGHGVGMSQYGAHGMAHAGFPVADILTHFYTGTGIQTLPQPSGIRVQVAASASVTITPTRAPVDLFLVPDGNAVGHAATGQPVTIRSVGNQLQLDNGPVFAGPGKAVTVLLDAGNPVSVSPPNARFHYGQVAFFPGAGSLQAVVVGLSMQQYLLGLGEMPSSWEQEALRAQAIAGRTYAKEAIDRRRATPSWTQPFDLYGSTQDQAYIGYEKETTGTDLRWVAAVNDTNDQTITYGGRPIQAFYFSSDGGTTENSEYVFAAALPYTRSVPDPYDGFENRFENWSRTYSTADLSRYLNADSRTGVGTVSSVRILGPLGASGRVDKAAISIVGDAATKQVTGSVFRSVVNAGVSRDGGGLDSQLLSTLFHPVSGPIANVEDFSSSPSGIHLSGWAFDPDTTDPIQVHVYTGSVGAIYVADGFRPDVGAAFPGYGSNHGFDISIPRPSSAVDMCAYAINAGPGENLPLGCRHLDPSPMGNLESARRAPGGVRVSGWSVDPDSAGSIFVDVYAGQTGTRLMADRSRGDVAAALPGYGANHGFDGVAATTGYGALSICAYGINVGPGGNSRVGCRTVNVLASPFGNLEQVTRSGGSVRVAGWAIDGDTSNAVDIHVYVNGVGFALGAASGSRPDVAAFYPDFGTAHGFDATVPAPPGAQVCVYAINAGPAAANTTLGCRSV